MKNKYLIILLILVLLGTSIISSLEQFETKQNIDCYVITLGKENKLVNVDKQQQKIPYEIQKINAVFGDELNIQQLVRHGIVADWYGYDNSVKRKRQIGCYMSHLKVLDIIKEKNTDSKYSIIFEDDFEITEYFMEQLNENMDVIDSLDFDVLFLGNILNGYGKNVEKNIYKKSVVYGTHGYLIKNANVSHIIESMKIIDDNIDLKYVNIDTLKVFIMHPCIVNQLRNEFESDVTHII
jgi:GR25 family glycosyltransferase involved in LPS biosynthesis